MKKKIIFLFVFISLFVCSFKSIHASDDYIDEIKDFIITATVNDDGSVDFIYEINWLVLDDEIGPLIYADIGVPNSDISNLKAYNGDVSSVKLMENKVRIAFSKEYHKDEVASFGFSFRANSIYNNTETQGEVIYRYTPAWFDEANVDNLAIRWQGKSTAKFAGAMKYEGSGCYLANTSLSGGERYMITVIYDSEEMAITRDNSYGDIEYESFDFEGFNLVVGVFLMIFILIIFLCSLGSLSSSRGFGGPSSSRRSGYSSSHSSCACASSCASSCACACACASSGGGRAGCSTKDFYNTNLKLAWLKPKRK